MPNDERREMVGFRLSLPEAQALVRALECLEASRTQEHWEAHLEEADVCSQMDERIRLGLRLVWGSSLDRR